MKLLLIALSFPPINNAQSIRWKYLVENLVKQGVNIEIIAPYVNSNIQLDLDIKQSTTIKRINPGKIVSLFFQKKDIVMREKKLFSLTKLLTYCAENLLLGELFWEWPFKVKNILSNEDLLQRYTAIIISVEPHIATALPALFTKHKNIVLDIGDPPVSNYFLKYPIFQRFHNFIFNLVIKKTKGVVYTSWNLKLCLEKKYKNLKEKKHTVIHQGYSNISIENSINIRKKKINLFYPGSFHKSIRNPKLLIDILSKKDNINFFFAGPSNPDLISLFRKKLTNRFFYIGNIPHSKVKSLYPKFDVLLYFGNKTACQLSGKFFEFIPTNAIILQIYQNVLDETLVFSKNTYTIIPVFYEKLCLNQAIKFIESLLSQPFSSNKIVKYRKLFFKEFSWYNLASKYLEFLETLK